VKVAWGSRGGRGREGVSYWGIRVNKSVTPVTVFLWSVREGCYQSGKRTTRPGGCVIATPFREDSGPPGATQGCTLVRRRFFNMVDKDDFDRTFRASSLSPGCRRGVQFYRCYLEFALGLTMRDGPCDLGYRRTSRGDPIETASSSESLLVNAWRPPASNPNPDGSDQGVKSIWPALQYNFFGRYRQATGQAPRFRMVWFGERMTFGLSSHTSVGYPPQRAKQFIRASKRWSGPFSQHDGLAPNRRGQPSPTAGLRRRRT